MLSIHLLPLLLATIVSADTVQNVARDDCKPCNPAGAKGLNPPAIGPELAPMYVDLLNSVKGIHFKRWEDDSSVEKRDSGMCCAQGSECVNLQGFNIPMCYDKFTTNFILADGSYGSITTGDYSVKDGSKANLISGAYTKSGGETGDIFANDPAAKPNTATLSIPPQWTGTGVGSAIPPTLLGSVVVFTTTIPATSYTGATTVAASTVVVSVSGVATPVATIPARTITGPTTIPAVTAVVTVTKASAASAASSSSSKSKGAAGHVGVDLAASFGTSLFSMLMYALYGL